jgi:hypothetical protein
MTTKHAKHSRAKARPFPQKAQVYGMLAALNQDFERVLDDLSNLEQFGLQSRDLSIWRVLVEEVRCETNESISLDLHDREEKDWAYFARLRQKWEKQYGLKGNGLTKKRPE